MSSETLVRLLHNAELLNGEVFTTLREAQLHIERWRQHYNTVRPHSSLGYRPPAPETIVPPASVLACATLQPGQTLANERRISSLETGIAPRGRPSEYARHDHGGGEDLASY